MPTRGRLGPRGINYWESSDRSDRLLPYLNAGNLTAINAQDRRTDYVVRNERARGSARGVWRDARNPLQTSNPAAFSRT